VPTPEPATRTPRYFQAALVVAVAIGLGFAVRLSSAIGLLIGAYVLSVALAGRVLLLAAARRFAVVRDRFEMTEVPSLDLPLTKTRTLRGRAAWLVPLGAFAVLTGMREGAFGEAPMFDVTLHHVDTSNNWTSNTSQNSNWSHDGPGAPIRVPLRDVPVHCIRPAARGSGENIARGFNQYVRCPEGAGVGVNVTFTLSAADAFCFVPLYKTATVAYSVDTAVNYHAGDFTGAANIHVSGTLVQTAFGVGSCRAFNEALGAAIAQTAVTQLDQFLAQN